MHGAKALLVALLALSSVDASAQLNGANQPRPNGQRSNDFGRPEEEMLRRAEIRREEETHKEMVERADEAALLGDELLNSFRKNSSLTRDDLKRLERLQKIRR